MKVAQCFTSYLPPTENWAYLLIQNADVNNYVVSPRFLSFDFFSPAFRYLLAPGRFQRFSPHQQPATKWMHNLAASLPPLHQIYFRRALADQPVDIIHSHFAPNGWRNRKLASSKGIPHVVSFYGYDYEYLPYTKPAWKDRQRILFEEASLILCEGAFGARKLVDEGCPESKVRSLHLGVKTGEIPFCRRAKPPGRLDLLQVAWLVEKKGHIYSVKAFSEALETCPNMTLTIVGRDRSSRGKSSVKQSLIKEINSRGIADKVRFVDYVDFRKLHDYLKDFHVFIHPSCYAANRDCEGGAPVVFLDAQATGMPIISTTHCDIPDEVIHGETGLLSPEKDVASLADSIRTFYLMKQDEFDAYSRRARIHVERHYDVKKSGAQLTDIYKSLV